VKLRLWVVLTLAVLTVGYLGVGLFIAARLSAPSRHPQERTPADLGLAYREVSLQSTDGLKFAGWWVSGDDPSRAVVLVPGIAGDKSDRHVVETAAVYARAGYGGLMIDLRAQGRFEGERITMGYMEVRGAHLAKGAWLLSGRDGPAWLLAGRCDCSAGRTWHGCRGDRRRVCLRRPAPHTAAAAPGGQRVACLLHPRHLPHGQAISRYRLLGGAAGGVCREALQGGSARRVYHSSSSTRPLTRWCLSGMPRESRRPAPKPFSGSWKNTSTLEPTPIPSTERGSCAFLGLRRPKDRL
jgi:hypothetical protein